MREVVFVFSNFLEFLENQILLEYFPNHFLRGILLDEREFLGWIILIYLYCSELLIVSPYNKIWGTNIWSGR
jgi:hypothetical protein